MAAPGPALARPSGVRAHTTGGHPPSTGAPDGCPRRPVQAQEDACPHPPAPRRHRDVDRDVDCDAPRWRQLSQPPPHSPSPCPQLPAQALRARLRRLRSRPVPTGCPGPLGLLGAPIGLADADVRTAVATPTAAQRAAVTKLGASARWNRFGTPAVLARQGGFLATGLSGDAVTAARSFLSANAAVFGLTTAAVADLQLQADSRMAGGTGHAVVLRQRFGGLLAGQDGLVIVGVAGGRVALVSSTLARVTAVPAAATLSPAAAWIRAAANVGRTVASSALGTARLDSRTGWTTFAVVGFAQPQVVRQRSLPSPDGAVRAVFEANVVDVHGGLSTAYTSFVDARTGAVLVRRNQVDQASETGTFQGVLTATAPGPRHPFTVDADTKTISVSAAAAITTNDIVLKLFNPSGAVLATSDNATSPETIAYPLTAADRPGVYTVQVSPFPGPTVPFTDPGNYAGTVVASDRAASTATVAYPPKWRYFLANPTLASSVSTTTTTDDRRTGCWVTKLTPTPTTTTTVPGCETPPGALTNLAARAPWDFDVRTNTPTSTTTGNAASTAEAWANPLAPGGLAQRPVKTNREYTDTFTDAWNDARCNPANLVPGGNDINAAVTSLFANHNRMHDFSYFLGFTEENGALQDSNFGLTAPGAYPAGREGDVEVGNVQAAAISGGTPSFLGRDNANQITLQDGIPGITNQYLFQPIAGAFYSPCVDGDLDFSVLGHEYTHAISNRMVGGPDDSLTSYQGGSMGESWSDQVALEYQFEHGYSTGADPFVEGPYATGNTKVGIRNYALDRNPLQYGDLGYDTPGPEVHSDGEPWSAAMFEVRAALVAKYDSAFPYADKALQLRCSQGDTSTRPPMTPLPADRCPGNRRWLQLMFDSFLLQQGSTSMLDARDAMLAADGMRFNGANQAVIADAFARRGLGQSATTVGGDDTDPVAAYDSAYATEGTLAFSAADYSVPSHPSKVGKLYVGDYQARVTPIADTDPNTALGSSVKMVAGTYRFVYAAPGYGLVRFSATVTAGVTTSQQAHLWPNLASLSQGATAVGSAGSIGTTGLIDDDEGTSWAATGQTAGVDVTTPTVNVDLAGGSQLIRSVRVSALLRPTTGTGDPDPASGSRFTALRRFAVETCNRGASVCASALPAGATGSPWTRIYTSAADAFPAARPRPLAPDLQLRSFDVPDTVATNVRLVTLENQCTGTPDYAGEQDDDPVNSTDCATASTRGQSVRAAEFEVFGYDSVTRPPQDPVVVTTMTAPATARAGQSLTSTIAWTNLGPFASQHTSVVATLAAGLTFVAGSGGTYNATRRTVTWAPGTVEVNGKGSVSFAAKVAAGTAVGTVLVDQAQFSGALTYSAPAAAVTTVTP